MTASLVVVVSGPPASGKTTLGRRLAAELALPFISRDGLKETLFDTLGVRDRAWSRQLGAASWELLFYVVEALVTGGASCVVESNFHAALAGERLRAIQARHGCSATQVVCVADDATLLRRFQARAVDGTRHPGHVDERNLAELAAVLRKRPDYRLALSGLVLEVDTSGALEVNVPSLADAIRAAASASS